MPVRGTAALGGTSNFETACTGAVTVQRKSSLHELALQYPVEHPPADTLSPRNKVGEGFKKEAALFLKTRSRGFFRGAFVSRVETSSLQNGTRHSKIGISPRGLSSVGRAPQWH